MTKMLTVMNDLVLNENQIFRYNGSPVTFQRGDSVMVNATQMAKPFGKRCNDFLSSKQTNELIDSLSVKTGISATSLVVVNQGGNNQGTWMHEDLALVFAQWLSPDFYLWCNDRIKELLQYGMTATQPTLEQMINNPDLVISLATQLKNERKEKERLQAEKEKQQEIIAIQSKEIKQAAPKLEYYDKNMSSEGLLTANMVAACLNISAIKLNKLLCEWGVQYKQSDTYFLFQKYREKGYTKHRPHPYTALDGTIKTRLHMYWTEAGKKFIIELYNAKMSA